jgi:Helix-turn-helix domain
MLRDAVCTSARQMAIEGKADPVPRAGCVSAESTLSNLIGVGELHLAQQDGRQPTTVATGSAPGESGVSVLSVRFHGSAHVSGVMRQHLLCFQMSPQVHLECRIGGRTLGHDAPAGSLAICPAGIDWSANADESVHLRLRRAVELVREARTSLSDISIRTGFADQSHLTRWVRRVYGVSPSQLIS